MTPKLVSLLKKTKKKKTTKNIERLCDRHNPSSEASTKVSTNLLFCFIFLLLIPIEFSI